MPLQSKEVLALLADSGVPTRREGLAEMSDALGLRTRTLRAAWTPRQWTPEQVEMLVLAFRLRRGWNLDVTDLQAVLKEGPAGEELVEQFRSTVAGFVEVGRTVLAKQENVPDASGLRRTDLAAQARRGAA